MGQCEPWVFGNRGLVGTLGWWEPWVGGNHWSVETIGRWKLWVGVSTIGGNRVLVGTVGQWEPWVGGNHGSVNVHISKCTSLLGGVVGDGRIEGVQQRYTF